MTITYDKEIDAAYIYFKHPIEPGEVANTYLCDPSKINGMINLDFDANDILLGIEIIGASKKLPLKILEQAIDITDERKI